MNLEELRQENADLRTQLAKAQDDVRKVAWSASATYAEGRMRALTAENDRDGFGRANAALRESAKAHATTQSNLEEALRKAATFCTDYSDEFTHGGYWPWLQRRATETAASRNRRSRGCWWS